MKYVGLSKLSYFVGSEIADTYHYYCYHGFERGGDFFASTVAHAWITQPGNELWLGEKSAQALSPRLDGGGARLDAVNYFPFSLPFELGSFAHHSDARFANDDGDSLMEALADLADEQPLKKSRLSLPVIERAETVSIAVGALKMGPTEWDPPTLLAELPASREIGFSCGDAHFFKPDIFSIIEPFLLKPLYTVREFEIG